MKIQLQNLLGIIFILVSVSINAAEKIMFKWTDDKGEVHYSEQAPKDYEYVRIRTYVDSNTATSSKAPTAAMNQEKAEEKKDSYGTWKDENCTIATQNLDMLENAGRIGIDDGQGGKRLMSDEEKQEKITQMEQQRDKYCKTADSDKK